MMRPSSALVKQPIEFIRDELALLKGVSHVLLVRTIVRNLYRHEMYT